MKKIKTGLGREIDEGLELVWSCYGRELIDWYADLWDTESGGFYYAMSARDHEFFRPDIESTNQSLNLIAGCGATAHVGGDLARAIPADVVENIRKFVVSLQAEDGYFYHPQWGRDVPSDRKGRDLSWAENLARRFDIKFPYPTANERLRHSGGGSDSGLPPHLLSREAFIEYLDRLDIPSHSHNKGHALNAQVGQIIAAGLADTLFDYCDDLQEKAQRARIAKGVRPNGMFQESVDYVAISGVFKLGQIYNAARRPFKYADYMIDSGIETVLSDVKPHIVIYVYNPWAGLGAAVANMKLTNEQFPGTYDVEAAYKKIRAAAPEMLRKTAEKLKIFKQPDGAFSFNPEGSAPYIYRTHASLGLAEGDVNATSIAINSVTSNIATALGIERPPIWDKSDFDHLIARATAKGSIVKKPLPEEHRDDPAVRR